MTGHSNQRSHYDEILCPNQINNHARTDFRESSSSFERPAVFRTGDDLGESWLDIYGLTKKVANYRKFFQYELNMGIHWHGSQISVPIKFVTIPFLACFNNITTEKRVKHDGNNLVHRLQKNPALPCCVQKN